MRLLALILTVLPLPLWAWETPPRGSADRVEIMDALRPHAEWVFGPPLVFVVDTLRVDGAVGFAMVSPQRPDGREMTRADLVNRPFGEDPFDYGGSAVSALLQRSGETWVATHWIMGASDAWWFDPVFCPLWASVIPEAC